ncbi:UvrD-helicase domain-containing protein [Arthrobacter sp.]|uniref:UvrD-helicase domain-containing protein n=1 Tax=Arthrobacter sp. TaxID=1667 RepID=UPI002585CF34|nr:UvrD-helicase domain-containing protein [Arthrobacter sp.]
MSEYWQPTNFAKHVIGAGDWQLLLDGTEVRLRNTDTTTIGHIGELEAPTFRRGIFWGTLTIALGGRSVRLTGLRNRDGAGLVTAVSAAIGNCRDLLVAREVVGWAGSLRRAIATQFADKGWLTRDFRNLWLSAKPVGDIAMLMGDPNLAERLGAPSHEVRDAVVLWNAELRGYLGILNEKHMATEATADKEFFDKVERSPLTEEQVRAVVCLDNRVQVIASAGSGKTSTMVAKAGYVLHRNLVPAEKILLLAFNADAAKELEQRIRDRLVPLGLDGTKVQAKTFHALGLEIIGQATGRKPSLAPWINDGADLVKLKEIVERLRGTESKFRKQWDLFRLVLARGLPEFGHESDDPTDWDPNSKSAGFRTLQGEVVKSHGERLIADWLFYNGVNYVYERPYEHETVDATHVQYHPDFYYPGINAYHEHFALDRNGHPPPEFTGYLDGVKWKRAVHRKFGTTLMETTMSELWDGAALERLSEEFTARGITLDPNPERPGFGPAPLKDEQLIRIFRTFLIHAKSNRLDDGHLRERVRAWSGTPSHFRHSVFLNLFEPLRAAWEQELVDARVIDFEDMLTMSADHLETGHWDPGHELVMVDEMQDASHARARLARALVDAPGRMLFAVGDDWQSINGFAGADLSVMTDFARWFGEGETLRLERTFRSPQSICNVSSTFVLKNPAQLRKQVVSSASEYSPSIIAAAVQRTDQYARAVRGHLDKLSARLRSGEIPAGERGLVTVLVLCRYRKLLHELQAAVRPKERSTNGWEGLDIRFHTVHGSKGLEADYVIIPGLTKGAYGFPSTIVDDPVLHLAMPAGDVYPLAEERRLFYVALTRAKRSVLLLSVAGKESQFLLELVRDHNIAVLDASGKATTAISCPVCRIGNLVQRTGKYGAFLGCSKFPACRHTQKPEKLAE